MIEARLKRPVRFFQYETATIPLFGGNAPRVALAHTEDGVTKPSLASQLRQFLISPEPGAAEITCVDVIAHSGRILKVKAGETHVLVLGDGGAGINDQDGDLLTDEFEQRIIGASSSDKITNDSHVVPMGDFDGDGLTELFELALGTDPIVPDSEGVLSNWIEKNGEGREFLVLRHPVSAQAGHLNILGQKSENLRFWSTCINKRTEYEAAFPVPIPRFVEWRIPLDSPDRFLRIASRDRKPTR